MSGLKSTRYNLTQNNLSWLENSESGNPHSSDFVNRGGFSTSQSLVIKIEKQVSYFIQDDKGEHKSVSELIHWILKYTPAKEVLLLMCLFACLFGCLLAVYGKTLSTL